MVTKRMIRVIFAIAFALFGISGVYLHTIKPAITTSTKEITYRNVETKRSIHDPSQPQVGATTATNTSTNEYSNETQAHEVKSPHHSIHIASLKFEYVKSPFIIAVFLITAGIAKLGFHKADFLSSKLPESCLLIILGIGVGAIMYVIIPADDVEKFGMSSELFFLYLLPPIILESSYSLHDRTFYDNVGTVLIYAVLGTILNCFLIGPSLYLLYIWGGMGSGLPSLNLIQCLVFSAIIVAVDPVAVLAIFQEIGVNNNLYFLVFGESLLNDAVTVVLYNMMKTLNLMDHITADQIVLGIVQFFVVSFGGLAIGIVFGALTAIITKYTSHCRVVEPLAVFVLAYLSYLTAEMFHFSGIISIIGCGLTQAQYAFHNISKKSYTTVKYFSKMMSATSDCVIFMFLGIVVFNADVLDHSNWHAGFILWTLLLCLLYRFLAVFLLTFILNKSKRITRIDLEEQFIMAYGGLRGAVAFSLVDVLNPANLPKGHFLTTTLVVILFTVFIQGSTIKPLVKLLRVKMEQNEKLLLSEEINTHVTDHVMAGIEEILGEKGEHYARELIEYYNRRYLKVWLQRDPISNDEQIMRYFEELALEQHFENLAGSKMIMEKYGSETDLLADDTLPNEDDERGSEDERSVLVQSITPSVNVSSEDISVDLDNELLRLRQKAGRRRKSLFPVSLSKEMIARLNENPTATDVRKIMVPTRRQMQYKRLDKNIKSDDSENDLLRYLQNKQIKTREISNAVWNQPICELPEIDMENARNARRRSIAPAIMTGNYKRRLSMATPTMETNFMRKRGASAGNALKTLDSPARRRMQLKLSHLPRSTESSSEEIHITGLSPIKEYDTKVGFALEMPTTDKEAAGISLDVISENSDENDSNPNSITSQTQSSQDTGTSNSHKLLTKPSSDPNKRQITDRVKSPEPNVKFLSHRDSPSVVRQKRFQKSKPKSVDLSSSSETFRLLEKDQKVGMRKNLSYQKAMSFDALQNDHAKD